MKRREFIKRGALAGTVLGFPTIIPSTVLGKNEKVAPSNRAAIGIIGCGGRASYAGMYKQYSKSEVVAVCDPQKGRRDRFSRKYNNCDSYNDFREILARKDIDAVHISTPDHWHLPIAMLAAKAKKDMYVEKPLGICIADNLKARSIVDKYKRVFQYGAQQRSIQHVRMGIELVLNGHIGEVKELYVWAPEGQSGGVPKEAPVPKGFDYDMWQGPAQERPFCQTRVSNEGVWFNNDYAIGFMGGWGAHPMDMLQWWADNAGMKEIPVKYEGKGKWTPDALFNTVSSWDVHTEYKNGLKMRFMSTGVAARQKLHPGLQGPHGTLFVGSEGWVNVSRYGWWTSSNELRMKAKDPGKKRLIVSKDQIQNFVDCVLTRETPVDDLHSAVRSDIATHLAEISIREGRPIRWHKRKEEIIGDKEAAKRMFREKRGDWKV